MLQRYVKSLIRILLSSLLMIAFTAQPIGNASALHSNSTLNAQLNYAIVFVSRKIPRNGTVYMAPNETGSLPGVGPFSRFEIAAPGKLIVREENGILRTLIDGANPGAASLNLIDVNAPDVSYDGKQIVFAGIVKGSYDTGPMNDPGGWRIYVINVDGTGLRQITFSDQDNLDLTQFRDIGQAFKKYDDTDPAWLPDGRIVFSSTRWPSHGMYGGARTSNLYITNSDATGIHRITSERNSADRPQVDPVTGKIVYSRWWRNFRVATNNMGTMPHPSGGYIMKDGLLIASRGYDLGEVGSFKNLERNAWHLATVNPDGTGLAQWAGVSNTTYGGQNINQAYGGSFAPDGSFYANFFPMANETEAAGFGGIRHYQRGPHGYTPVIGITTRDETILKFVKTNPNSYGVYQGNYAAEPEVLPDGRLIISWAKDVAQDYGIYIINTDGSGLTPLYDNPGTTEIRTRVIRPRPIPPIVPDKITQVASLLPPLAQGPYDKDGTFTFKDLNVYFNAPVDTNIISAIPVGSAGTIRFFIDHQRWQQSGSFENLDWPILLNELPVKPDGSITTSAPANVPLFEQIRTKSPDYTVPLTGRTSPLNEKTGAAHVAGMNFGRPGEVVTCVGCHAGHSMIPVPENPADAQWTNLAPGAAIKVSSLNSSLTNTDGLIDRRVKMRVPNTVSKYWLSKSGLTPTSQWVQLTFPVPVTVRTVRLYNIPSSDSSVKVLNATVRLYTDKDAKYQVANKQSGALSENGTDVAFNDVYSRIVRIELNSVNGAVAGLGEVEVIAHAEADVPPSTISGSTGIANTIISYSSNETVTNETGAYSVSVPTGWFGTVTPSHPCYTFNPTSRSYSNVITNQTNQDYTVTFNQASGCADVNIKIGGNQKGQYGIPSGGKITPSFAGVQSGPVKISSNIPVFTSERALFGPYKTFNEVMGFPDNQLTNHYWFPWYDNKDMRTWILVGNPSNNLSSHVTIKIGGQTLYSKILSPNAIVTPTFGTTQNGPVEVISDNPIFTSERALFGSVSSFNEVMGFPDNQLTNHYWFPWYDGLDMKTWVLVGNPDSANSAKVTIKVAGQTVYSKILEANAIDTPTFGAIRGGPVEVISDNSIITSERALFGPAYTFNEVMGFPDNQLTNRYWFPWYDNKDMMSWVLVGNPSNSSSANVTIKIAGQQVYSRLLGPNAIDTPTFGATQNGPVEVISDNPIFTSERALFGPASSFNEVMGFPNNKLTTDYWFTWYDSKDMMTWILVSKP